MPTGVYKRTKEVSIETRKKISNRLKGKTNSKDYKHTKEWKRKASERNKGDKNPAKRLEVREKMRRVAKKNWENTKYKQNFINRMKKITHHINGCHNDNRPENLMVMSQSEHVSLHWRQGDMR